jgi:hypothetical protein
VNLDLGHPVLNTKAEFVVVAGVVAEQQKMPGLYVLQLGIAHTDAAELAFVMETDAYLSGDIDQM